MTTFSLVLPCYNEGDNISDLLLSIEKLKKSKNNLEILLVENGSTDKSLEKIKKHPVYKNNHIKLVEIKKNLGYGHGIMAGVYKSSGDFIGWCHADLQNNLDEVYNAFENNLNKLSKKNMILKGKRLNRNIIDVFFTSSMALIASFLFNQKLNDINAQPKIFPREFLESLKNPPDDFSLDLYLLLIAKKMNYEICEHPLIVYKRIAGKAKGGGSFYTKIKLTLRTISYIYNLKKNRKFQNGNNCS